MQLASNFKTDTFSVNRVQYWYSPLVTQPLSPWMTHIITLVVRALQPMSARDEERWEGTGILWQDTGGGERETDCTTRSACPNTASLRRAFPHKSTLALVTVIVTTPYLSHDRMSLTA